MSPTTATPQILLAHHLKQLRLPTILRCGARYRQARQNSAVLLDLRFLSRGVSVVGELMLGGFLRR